MTVSRTRFLLAVLCPVGVAAPAAPQGEAPVPRWREGGTPYNPNQPPQTQQSVEKLNPGVGPTFQSVISGPPRRVDRLESLSHILLQRTARPSSSRDLRKVRRMGDVGLSRDSIRR
jgi:hypothetical protein